MRKIEFDLYQRAEPRSRRTRWIHEINRTLVQRDGDRVRLFTRNGYDWIDRYPWIVEAALKNRQKSFALTICPTWRCCTLASTMKGAFHAFDMLAVDGDDLRQLQTGFLF